MKHVTAHNRAFRFAALLGLTAVFGGLVAQTPANAQYPRDRQFHHDGREFDRQELRYDATTLRREQDHLRDLQDRRKNAVRRHDRNAVRRLDVAIRDTQWRMDNKRFDTKHDYDTFYNDRDREYFRNHNYH